MSSPRMRRAPGAVGQSGSVSGASRKWCAQWAPRSIAEKELFPIVLAPALWGASWSGAPVKLAPLNSTLYVQKPHFDRKL